MTKKSGTGMDGSVKNVHINEGLIKKGNTNAAPPNGSRPTRPQGQSQSSQKDGK